MNTLEHENTKTRGSADISYLGRTVDAMIWQFMDENQIPGLTLAIVQAPYIPRVIGYGLSDAGQKRLASVNTMWPAGPISQAFAAVAIMQLYEDGRLNLEDAAGRFIPELPEAWKDITVLNLLRHSSGLADFRDDNRWDAFREWSFKELLGLIAGQDPHFAQGTDVLLSAANCLLIAEIIERVSGQSYHDFVAQRQIKFLGLKHTGFAEDLDGFKREDVSKSGNSHELFKKDSVYIDPTEPAASYDAAGLPIPRVNSSALKGFSDIWASAQDISFWDIALAGSILVKSPENRDLLYKPWKLSNGREIPAVAGWRFYKHRGLMDSKGSVAGYSSFLSRFTHPEELVCVTLLANKEGVDFTNLGRRIAGAFGDLLSTNYDDNKLYLTEAQLSVAATVERLEKELEQRGIPVFAKFDHAKNAQEAALELRPTTVLVFGLPNVGTELMQADQSISLELPLKISVWEDEAGSTWLAFLRLKRMAEEYGLDQHPAIDKMEILLEDLAKKVSSVY